jgi:glycosyltransferase involved in cell wall biosynthesis
MKPLLRVAVFHNLHSGGALRTTWEQVRRLSAHHQLTLYTLSTAECRLHDFRPYVTDERVWDFHPGTVFASPWGRLNALVRSADLLGLQNVSRAIAQDIDREGFDVVLVHPCQFTQSPMVLQHLNTPTVYYCHEPLRGMYESNVPRPYRQRTRLQCGLDALDPARHSYQIWLKKADRESLRSARRLLVNSIYTGSNVRRLYGVGGLVCYHGVDSTRFRRLGLERNAHVLSVGAMTPLKGFDLIIEALGLLPAEERPALVLISNYTENQERAYIEALALERGVNLEIRVAVNEDELVVAYNRALFLAYAPHREPLGLAPLEAMACGTPVVAVAEGGVQETVAHGRTGLLASRSPEEFAEAMLSLIRDRERLEEMGVCARQDVLERWNWSLAIHYLEIELIAAAMEGRRGR